MADTAPPMLRDCPKCSLPAEEIGVVDGQWLRERYGLGYPGTAYTIVVCVARHMSAEAEIRV